MLNKNFKIIDIRNLLYEIYNDDLKRKQIQSFSNNQIKKLAKYLKNGVPFGIPPFSNFKEKDINRLLDLAFSDNDLNKNIGLSETKKQIYLYDGVTGKKFDRPITVGVMYFLKLNHLVEDKIHARSVGPYSLITQQPLKGKSNMGGQRLGEMEV